ncbi:hypothetical protein B0O80DRAFT_472183 [Mortierella sp. GBAus27b]|nr:hypothetical protein B0O80DRAFT_472183 [Mortierella sp. GBAus27b]
MMMMVMMLMWGGEAESESWPPASSPQGSDWERKGKNGVTHRFDSCEQDLRGPRKGRVGDLEWSGVEWGGTGAARQIGAFLAAKQDPRQQQQQ